MFDHPDNVPDHMVEVAKNKLELDVETCVAMDTALDKLAEFVVQQSYSTEIEGDHNSPENHAVRATAEKAVVAHFRRALEGAFHDSMNVARETALNAKQAIRWNYHYQQWQEQEGGP